MKFISKKLFTTFKITQNNNLIHEFNSQNANVNWSLASYLINPKGLVTINKLTQTNQQTAEISTVLLKTSKELGPVKFNQFYRKMGKLISQSEEIFIQSGKVEGKPVNIISSEKEAIQSVISDKNYEFTDNFDSNSTAVLLLTKGELNVKKFAFSDKEQKVVLTNFTGGLKDVLSNI